MSNTGKVRVPLEPIKVTVNMTDSDRLTERVATLTKQLTKALADLRAADDEIARLVALVDRQLARLKALEVERDTARREADDLLEADRVAQARTGG